MLTVAPRRLALLLLATACYHDDPPAADSDASTTLASTTTVSPTSEGSDTSTGDDSSGTSTGCVPTAWYPDLDRDGHDDTAAPQLACTRPAGHVEVGDDDEDDAARAPDLTEVCDDRDNDCDPIVDEFSPQNPSCKECTLYARRGRSYAFCTLARVWTDARGECMKRGGDLVVIDDGSENSDLAAQGATTIGTAAVTAMERPERPPPGDPTP